VANYQDFFSTQPPLFSKVEEPLHADAWLRTIESKFALLTIPYADSNKAHFAAQQLRGAARIWWIIIVPCKPMAMLSPEKNFGMLSEHIIYLKD
jgi:hypothetical protein